jgi:hypothetical protein
MRFAGFPIIAFTPQAAEVQTLRQSLILLRSVV